MMKKLYFTRIDINIHIEDKTATRERDEVYNGVRAGDWTEGVEVQSSRGKRNLNSIEQRVEAEQNNPLFGF